MKETDTNVCLFHLENSKDKSKKYLPEENKPEL